MTESLPPAPSSDANYSLLLESVLNDKKYTIYFKPLQITEDGAERKITNIAGLCNPQVLKSAKFIASLTSVYPQVKKVHQRVLRILYHLAVAPQDESLLIIPSQLHFATITPLMRQHILEDLLVEYNISNLLDRSLVTAWTQLMLLFPYPTMMQELIKINALVNHTVNRADPSEYVYLYPVDKKDYTRNAIVQRILKSDNCFLVNENVHAICWDMITNRKSGSMLEMGMLLLACALRYQYTGEIAIEYSSLAVR